MYILFTFYSNLSVTKKKKSADTGQQAQMQEVPDIHKLKQQ